MARKIIVASSLIALSAAGIFAYFEFGVNNGDKPATGICANTGKKFSEQELTSIALEFQFERAINRESRVPVEEVQGTFGPWEVSYENDVEFARVNPDCCSVVFHDRKRHGSLVGGARGEEAYAIVNTNFRWRVAERKAPEGPIVYTYGPKIGKITLVGSCGEVRNL